jgi:transposase
MPRAYPAEFRRRAVALVKAGRSVAQAALDLDVTQTTIYNWVKQDRIDSGELPGRTTAESKELVKARRRIRELETEVEILRRANALLGSGAARPKGSTRRSTSSLPPGSA